MKLLKTIERLIKESEDLYFKACDSNTPLEELDRLERNYKNSLKLLRIYESSNKNIMFKNNQ